MTKKDIHFLNYVVTCYKERKTLTENQFNSLKLLEKELNQLLIINNENKRKTFKDEIS
tara:strand:+ start:624 stop:797 length:174 start_codon:yes stop_codon:yes gene_type:complete